jgi:ABC-type nitrate/sulfonate/bicarbonate transport system permease component
MAQVSTAPPTVTAAVRPGKRARINPYQVGRWILSILLFFVGWEILGSSGVLFYIKPPSEVLPTLWEEITRGEILSATWGSLQLALAGFVLGTILGIFLGTLTGVSDKWAWVIDPLVSGGWAVPIVMFIPVISIYAGLEFKGKVLLVVLMNIFVIIVNTSTGVREVPAEVREMAHAFGVSKRNMYRKIIFPWAAPYILTGLRLGLGRSVQGAILADLFLRADNLGLYITYAASSFQIETLLAAVLFITILAAGLMLAGRAVEWWLLRWKAL